MKKEGICKTCGKPRRECFCYIQYGVEDIAENLEEYKKKGVINANVTREEVEEKMKKPPTTEEQFNAFMDALGINAAQRRKFQKSLEKIGKRAAKAALTSIIDEFLSEDNDEVIEADYKVECPECHKMVDDLKGHTCEKKTGE